MRAGPNFSATVLRLSTLILLAGCADATRPTEPPAVPPAPAPVAPPIAPPIAPPLSRSGVAYGRISPSFFPGAQHYVLYNDSTFSLLYGDNGGLDFPGRFSRADSAITFRFDGWNVAGPWEARGVIRGDSLTVKYNDVMVWSDFEDGVYVRSPGQ